MASRLWVSKAASYLKNFSFNRGFASAGSVGKYLKYADSHEWVKLEGNSAIIGITDHGLNHLGDVVHVELPEVGATVTQGSTIGAVKSVMTTSGINSPVSGKIIGVNKELTTSPGLVTTTHFRYMAMFVFSIKFGFSKLGRYGSNYSVPWDRGQGGSNFARDLLGFT